MKRWFKAALILFAGVAQPLAAIAYELTTGQCAAIFFDPLPTPLHGIAVAAVPLINLRTWWAIERGGVENGTQLLRWNGFAIGIALFYAVLFLPLVPIGFVGIVIGLGLLPLAPLAALIVAVVLRRALKRSTPTTEKVRSWPAVVCGLVALSVLELPAIVTQVGLQMAASTDPVEHAGGVRLLRLGGNNKAILRACYVRGGHLVDVFSLLISRRRHVSPEAAREIYYRVTGEPFNSQPLPSGLEQLRFDRDLGATFVGQHSDGLKLVHSELNGSIDPAAALAYFEWTLEIENTSDRIAEGRLQMSLPVDAVVSRVTLWIDGEAREAAFGSSAAVRAAYDKVVARQRDPLLVTASGPDTVLVQLFPIPARGGAMRFRLGITAPLELATLARARLVLPGLRERNFAIAPTFRHGVRFAAKRVLASSASDLVDAATPDGAYEITGSVSDPQNVRIDVIRDAAVRRVYTADPGREPAATIVQRIVNDDRRYGHVVLVVDGSTSMAAHREAIVDAVARSANQLRWTVLVAQDEVRELVYHGGDVAAELARDLARLSFDGGMDNSAALARAGVLARGHEDTAVLWLHGPQVLDPAPALANSSALGTPLYALQLTEGPNLILEAFSRSDSVQVLRTGGDLGATLGTLFARWRGTLPGYRYERDVIAGASGDDGPVGVETSAHLARLWANDLMREMIADPGAAHDTEAAALGLHYQLVSAVTGAVVLETASEFAAAGLEAVDSASVPTVPEPELIALLVIALTGLAVFHRRGRGTRCAP